jgi:hypothetical protein
MTYCSIAVSVIVIVDRFVTEIDTQLATHDFVIVKVPYS